MKILKPGKVEQRKFTCPKCGCVFVASESEMNGDIELMVCPQDGCHYYAIGWDDGEPYEEPVKHRGSDVERLTTMLEGIRLNSEVWSWAGIARHLVAHGVTFREE